MTRRSTGPSRDAGRPRSSAWRHLWAHGARAKATVAEAELRGKPIAEKTLEAAAEAAMAAADPQSDKRGSAAYKRSPVGVLVRRAAEIALRRARGEKMEAGHIYA